MLIILLPYFPQLYSVHESAAFPRLIYHTFGLILMLMVGRLMELFLENVRTESWGAEVSELPYLVS